MLCIVYDTCMMTRSQHRQSSLVELLVTMWSWGDMSATTVQKIARAAKDDGLDHAHVDQLARLGTSGMYANHVHRDFVEALRPPQCAEAISTFNVPLKNPLTKAIFYSDQPVLWPHQMFACLYKSYPRNFEDRVRGHFFIMSDHNE